MERAQTLFRARFAPPPSIGASLHPVLVLDPSHEHAIARLLDVANARRTARVMSRDEVLQVAEEALREGYALRTAGTVDDARALTALCLAVRTEKNVVIGIGPARANAPEPGQLWPLLERWLPDGSPRALQRARSWARRVREKFITVPLPTAPAARTAEQTLFQAVIEDPDALEPRRVYADQLLAAGDPRGELIHVQLLRETVTDPQRQAELNEREVVLKAPLEQRWRDRLADRLIHLEFRRGFVERATLHAAAVFEGLAELLESEPVRYLRIIDLSPDDVPRLAMAPWLKRLLGLELTHLQNPDRRRALNYEDVIRLLDTDGLRALKRLGLAGHRIEDMGAMVLARNLPAAAPKLEQLQVARDELTPVGVGTLAEAAWFQRLTSIDLSGNKLGTGAAELVAECVSPAKLRELDLSTNLLGDEGARALAGAPRLSGLLALGLYANHIGAYGAKALLDSPYLSRVKQLNLGGNRIGSLAARRLAERANEKAALTSPAGRT
jgi:uncharacterized protein (TIGR02996 family)